MRTKCGPPDPERVRPYNIMNEKDLEQAARSLSTYCEKQTVTLAVRLAE